jgi:hypothetical protein
VLIFEKLADLNNTRNPKFVQNKIMQTLIIELDSKIKAKELSSLLSSLDFVKKVSSISKPKALIATLQEHENLKASIVKRKNKAIAKYI